MANTYTQMYIQCVFAVKGRDSSIKKDWQEELHKYITGIIQNRGHKLIAINSARNHIHLFIGMKPHQSLSDLMRDVKAVSSKFVNEKKYVRNKFSWQEGFGAFSYSQSHVDAVVRYIKNQENHHRQKTFAEEYREMLNKHNVAYDVKFVFDEN